MWSGTPALRMKVTVECRAACKVVLTDAPVSWHSFFQRLDQSSGRMGRPNSFLQM